MQRKPEIYSECPVLPDTYRVSENSELQVVMPNKHDRSTENYPTVFI